MKNIFLFTGISMMIGTHSLFAQGLWQKKADFPGPGRKYAVTFSIAGKGYVGTGQAIPNDLLKDFWEWDQTTNVWTQKADFAGGVRYAAVGFSIVDKGYVGTGNGTGQCYNDLWEFDPFKNEWTKKANFPGTARSLAVGFSIGNKGYIGTGYDDTNSNCEDFWEWDQFKNKWTEKANFGGGIRNSAIAFSIANKGYIGTGNNGRGAMQDFWEWDQASDQWIQKSIFPGAAVYGAVGFSIDKNGYISTGVYESQFDLWEWKQTTNTWAQKTNFGGGPRAFAAAFSIKGRGYIGLGWANSADLPNDLWEFIPDVVPVEVPKIESGTFLNVYPNPTDGTIQIIYSSNSKSPPAGWGGTLYINIVNWSGRLIYTETVYDFEGEYNNVIDLGGHVKGTYTIEIDSGHQKKVTREVLN